MQMTDDASLPTDAGMDMSMSADGAIDVDMSSADQGMLADQTVDAMVLPDSLCR